MALFDDLKKKATKELDKQMKNPKNKEKLEKRPKKDLKKDLKSNSLFLFKENPHINSFLKSIKLIDYKKKYYALI